MNPRLFQAYIMVDWSAASKPTTGPDSVWIGVMKRNVRFQMAFEAFNPATRAEAEKLLDAQLAELSRKSERVMVGFDFPLGFPRGTAAALKLEGAPWRALI
ncbi:MAG TPA: cobalamin biosynthesis protein CbiG, partial [Terricaulis sp.]|nr:cobalamin biosynthesis protein CbiG [Terricaulis sp.]